MLDWESYSEYDSGWTDLTPFDRSGFMPLDYASLILWWFRTRLLGLESIEENVWEPVVQDSLFFPPKLSTAMTTMLTYPPLHSRKLDTFQGEPRYLIKESIGLELPWHESYHPEYEFKGSWAYFAEEAADVPHAVVTMLDSFCPSADDCHAAFFRSEVQAAVKMTEFQLQQAPRFTHHRTISVLICTFFGNETARVTQAHFDGVRNQLVVRLSRLLDLSGPNTL